MKQEKNEKVIVNIRIRPFTKEEAIIDKTTPIEAIDLKTNSLIFRRDLDAKPFSFDRIYSMNSTQEDIFNLSAKGVIDAVIKGYNGTIFAYGQTGSGKTYTMSGEFESSEKKGIIPRAINYIFSNLPNEKGYKQYVFVSFIQIYLETIQDLLNLSNNEIRIREDPEEGVFLEGVEWFKVSSPEDVRSVYLYGEKNRVTESTKMNAHSSRSHAIFIIRFEKTIMQTKEKMHQISKKSNEQILSERVLTRSNLYLVDLAGSERVSKSKAVDLRLEETKKINYSLLVLGNCISSLIDPKSNHVSYRDSKLTRLLQESLGGNAKTSMIVTLSPSSYNKEETFSSLNFALRAMKIQNKPLINKIIDYQALSIKLQEDLDKLIDAFASMKIQHETILLENSKIKGGEEYLEMQKRSLGLLLDDSNSNPLRHDINNQYQVELNKLKAYYEKVIENNKRDNQNILNEIDRILYDKETEIEALKNTNNRTKALLKELNDKIEEIQNENNDLKQNVLYLTNKTTDDNNQLINKSFNSSLKDEKDNNTHPQANLNVNANAKENGNSNINEDDIINDHVKEIENEIDTLKNKKQNLSKTLRNKMLQASKNEIQIRINKDELYNSITDIDEKKKESLTKEIAVKAEENNSFLSEKIELNKEMNTIENEIEIKEDLKKQIKNSKLVIENNLTQWVCETIINDTNYKVQLENINKEYQTITKEKEMLSNENNILIKANEELSSKMKLMMQNGKSSEKKLVINQAIEHRYINNKSSNDTKTSLIRKHKGETLTLISRNNTDYKSKSYLKIINLNNEINYIGNKKESHLQTELGNKINEIKQLNNKLIDFQTIVNNLKSELEVQKDLNSNLNEINTQFSNQVSSLNKLSSEVEKINHQVISSPLGNIDSSNLIFLLNNEPISDLEETEENGMNTSKSIIDKSSSLQSTQCLNQLKTNSKMIIDDYKGIVNVYLTTLTKAKQSFALLDEIKKSHIQNIQKINSLLSTYNDLSLSQFIQQKIKSITAKTSIQDIVSTTNLIYNDFILNFVTSTNKKQKDKESNEAVMDQVGFNSRELSQTSNSSDRLKIHQYETQIETMTTNYEAEINEQQKKIALCENTISEMDNDLNKKNTNIEMSTKINFVLVYILMLVILSVIIY